MFTAIFAVLRSIITCPLSTYPLFYPQLCTFSINLAYFVLILPLKVIFDNFAYIYSYIYYTYLQTRQRGSDMNTRFCVLILSLLAASVAYGEDNRQSAMRMMDSSRTFMNSMEAPIHTQYNLETLKYSSGKDLKLEDFDWFPRHTWTPLKNLTVGFSEDTKHNFVFLDFKCLCRW